MCRSAFEPRTVDSNTAHALTLSRRGTTEQVETFLPESAAFMKLLELERQMDYTLRRKRLAIHEALHRPARVRGTLRVYLFNTYANQADQKSADPDAPPSWTLYVSGRLVDGQPTTPAQVAQQVRCTSVFWPRLGGEETHGTRPARSLARHQSAPGGEVRRPVVVCRPQALQKQAEATPLPGSTPKTALKFSTFIQSAKIVVLNPKTAAPSESIVWDAQKATEACDAFEVKRLGDADTKVQVQLTLGSSPDRFQLSAALASLLGITIESRMYIIASLWQVGRPPFPRDVTSSTRSVPVREDVVHARYRGRGTPMGPNSVLITITACSRHHSLDPQHLFLRSELHPRRR